MKTLQDYKKEFEERCYQLDYAGKGEIMVAMDDVWQFIEGMAREIVSDYRDNVTQGIECYAYNKPDNELMEEIKILDEEWLVKRGMQKLAEFFGREVKDEK